MYYRTNSNLWDNSLMVNFPAIKILIIDLATAHKWIQHKGMGGMCTLPPFTAHVCKIFRDVSRISLVDKVDGLLMYLTTEIQTYLTKQHQLLQFPNMIRRMVQDFCGHGQKFCACTNCALSFNKSWIYHCNSSDE